MIKMRSKGLKIKIKKFAGDKLHIRIQYGLT